MSACSEVNILQKRREAIIPSTGGLLEAIEGLFELADKMWMARINITRRLIHINVLVESAMEKSIAHILAGVRASHYEE